VVFLSAAAADNVGVDGVRFSVDGVALSPTPCRVGWGVLGLLAGALGCDRAELADDLPLGFGHFVDVQPTAMARLPEPQMEHRAVEGVDDLLVVASPAGRQRHPNERPVLAIEPFLDGHQGRRPPKLLQQIHQRRWRAVEVTHRRDSLLGGIAVVID
jgi:hypothetical protein